LYPVRIVVTYLAEVSVSNLEKIDLKISSFKDLCKNTASHYTGKIQFKQDLCQDTSAYGIQRRSILYINLYSL